MEERIEYVCGVCGDVIDYENVTWRDDTGKKHIVCVSCDDILSEDYTEDELPPPEAFKIPV